MHDVQSLSSDNSLVRMCPKCLTSCTLSIKFNIVHIGGSRFNGPLSRTNTLPVQSPRHDAAVRGRAAVATSAGQLPHKDRM